MVSYDPVECFKCGMLMPVTNKTSMCPKCQPPPRELPEEMPSVWIFNDAFSDKRNIFRGNVTAFLSPGGDYKPLSEYTPASRLLAAEEKLREAIDKRDEWEGLSSLTYSENTQLIEKLKEAEKEKDKLKLELHNARYDRSKVSIHGTDGCLNCETGRITVFAASRYCPECEALTPAKETKDG